MHSPRNLGVADNIETTAASTPRRGPRSRARWLAVLIACVVCVSGQAATVYLEDSPAAKDLAEEAERLLGEGRRGEAAQRLHRIVEAYPEKLMLRDENLYTDARLWVRDRLAADGDLQTAYRSRFGGEARRAFSDAVAEGGGHAEPAVRRVWESYAWTRAGLDAALWLAGTHLERGDADGALAALAPLSMHPDLPERAASHYELRAWAFALAERHEDVEQSVAALRDIGETAKAEALAETLQRLSRPGSTEDRDGGKTLEAPPLDRALWEVQIVDAAESAQSAAVRNRNVQANSVRDDLRPVASETLLLFNDTLRVFALDRTSGRLRWVHRQEIPTTNNGGSRELAILQARQMALGRSVSDSREVLLSGRWAYAVLGNITALRGQRRGQTIMPTQLVCLDVETGQPRWTTSPGELDETLARAAFHGTPIRCGDQIIVMARRSQASSFQDSYLMSVDAETGSLRWRRHLASTAGTNQRNAIVALSSVTLDGQRLFFCDNLGAAAAVDALTGAVLWVRVFSEAEDQRQEQFNRFVTPASAAGQPTLCPAGLVLPIRVAEARALLLDPETGELKRRLTEASPIAGANQLLPLPGGDLLAAGLSFHRLDGRTLEPRWSQADIEFLNAANVPVTLQADRNAAIISSTPKHFDELDLTTGEVRRRYEVPWTGHVLALDHAWVISDGPRVGSYLDWPIAYAELTRRAAANPESPVPGLSMATLALNAGRSDAMSEGINRALGALSRLPADPQPGAANNDAEARARVFRELLALTEKPETVDPALIESLFDRLAAMTETPSELVAYNLARGEFLEGQQRFAEAASFYQAVLLDPRLAEELWSRNQSTRRADLVAQQRLLDILDKHGRSFYEDFEAKAQQAFTTLELDPTATAQEYRDLVRQYPLARVAAQATLAAADRQANSPTYAGAAVQYRRAFQLADDDLVRARAAGALASHYQERGQPDAAIAWLTSLSRRHPDLQPVRGGVPYAVGVWLDELRAIESSPSFSSGLLMPLGEPVPLEGSLVRQEQPLGVANSGNAILLQNNSPAGEIQLVLHDVATGRTRWTAPLPMRNASIIHLGSDNLILWSRSDRTLYGLDATTGKTLWPSIEISPLLEELGEGGLASTRRANAGQIIELIEADFGPQRQNNVALNNRRSGLPRIVAGEAVICVVDTMGRAVGIDRYTGRVLWQSALALDTVSHVVVGPETLAVAGLAAPGTEAQAGRIMLLDQVTGRLRFPVIEEEQPVTWLEMAPERGLVVGSRSRFTLIDSTNGSALWRYELDRRGGNHRVTLATDTLFLIDNNGLTSIDLLTGRKAAETALAQTNIQLLPHGNSAVGRLYSGDSRIACVQLGPDLNVQWRDVIQVEQKRYLKFELGAKHAWIVQKDRRQMNNGKLDLLALELDTGRLAAHRVLSGLSPHPIPSEMRVLDNHLLLAGRDWVLLIPGSRSPD